MNTIMHPYITIYTIDVVLNSNEQSNLKYVNVHFMIEKHIVCGVLDTSGPICILP